MKPPRPGTVVLVDDDRDFLEMNRSVLESRGYATASFSDPQAALDAMETMTPLLVISDLMMKALDSGFSLARTVKSNPRLSRVPVIIVTAVGSRMGFDFRLAIMVPEAMKAARGSPPPKALPSNRISGTML